PHAGGRVVIACGGVHAGPLGGPSRAAECTLGPWVVRRVRRMRVSGPGWSSLAAVACASDSRRPPLATGFVAVRGRGSSRRSAIGVGPAPPRPHRLFVVAPPEGDPRCEREPRSEEHTSELQSRENLVCRLLLEKKNN